MPTDTTSKKTIEERLRASQARKRRQRLIMLLVMGHLVVITLWIGIVMTRSNEPAAAVPAEAVATPEQASDLAPQPPQAPPEKDGDVEPAPNFKLVSDDGRTLWVSPTAGKPLSLRYLPSGCQFILHLRPAELLATEEGQRAWRALGPAGEQAQRQLEALLGQPLAQVEMLLVGARPTSQGLPQERVLVAKVDASQLPKPVSKQTPLVLQNGTKTYLLPDEDGMIVIASRPLMEEVLALKGEPPLLGRELELLVSQTDGRRQMTLLVTPSYLFTQSKPLLQGIGKPLADPLTERLPRTLKAAAVSLHLADNLYLETRVATTGRARLPQVAKGLGKLLRDLPEELQLAVLDADPDKYGRRVVAKLPAMARLLATQSRLGIEDRQIITNAYLPLEATHNLLLASELMLSQLAGPGEQTQQGNTITNRSLPASIAERLQMPVSVAFDRDTLEMAIKYLSEEIQTPIVIQGRDLQLDGITKNQSFGLDANNQPAGEVLATILKLANPDKSATGLSDEKQKLVYVVDNQSTTPKIIITTRAAAKKRGDQLPSLFTSE